MVYTHTNELDKHTHGIHAYKWVRQAYIGHTHTHTHTHVASHPRIWHNKNKKTCIFRILLVWYGLINNHGDRVFVDKSFLSFCSHKWVEKTRDHVHTRIKSRDNNLDNHTNPFICLDMCTSRCTPLTCSPTTPCALRRGLC